MVTRVNDLYIIINYYELVQAQRRIFCPPPTPHAITTRMSHIWYHGDRHKQWKRVAYTVFGKGPRTGASSENGPRRSTGVQIVRHLPWEEKKEDPLVLLDKLIPGVPRHVCTKFFVNIRRID